LFSHYYRHYRHRVIFKKLFIGLFARRILNLNTNQTVLSICGWLFALFPKFYFIFFCSFTKPLFFFPLTVTSIVTGYVISRSSFNNCLNAHLKQIQQQRAESAKSESQVLAKEPVFVDPYAKEVRNVDEWSN
jgi:hypothetical protein